MNSTINSTTLKIKYPNLTSIFYSTFNEVIEKALQAQVRRNFRSSRLNYTPIIKKYYPFITDTKELSTLSSYYSDHFNRRKHLYVDQWKSSLPYVFKNIETQTPTKSTSIVDLAIEDVIEQKEQTTDPNLSKLYIVSVIPNQVDQISFNIDNLPANFVRKIINFINTELFSFPQDAE